MDPVPVCLVEADVRPPEGIEPTHATHRHLPMRVVQGDQDRRYEERSGSEDQKQRSQVPAKEVSVEMFVAALEPKKKDAQQKLSLKKATRAGMTADSRSVGSSGANQGVRRSSRLKASTPRPASSASLFVAEHETESEFSGEDDETLPAVLDETNSGDYTAAMATAPSEILFGDLPWPSETPIENIHEIEVVQSRHALELEPSSPMLYRPFSDPAESGVSVSPARDTEVENSDSGDMVMQDVSTPQFFNEAFEDLYGSPLQHESQIGGEEITVACQKQYPTDPTHTPSLGNDLMFQSYLDLACRASFCLPHESVEDADSTEIRELLLPLVEGTPLTPRLLHGLIYSLVPGPLRILEVDPIASDGGMLADESLAENFAIILRESEEALPLLVLGAANRKMLFVLSSGTANLPFLSALYQTLHEWKTEYIKQYGISSKLAVSQQIDIRLAETSSEVQLQPQLESNEVFVSKIETFDLKALHEALLQKPADISRGRCLKILQCVYEIGSLCILDSLKPALTTKRENQAHQAMEQPVVEKLFRIHLYLDSQESESHLLIARSRYVKYCYFETYLLAVAALQREKRSSSREKRRIHARKLTASFKQGLCDELPPTPHDDEIHRIYEDLSPSEKKRRAQDMVKNEISRKVAKEHRVDEKRVQRNINRYIREGRVLHCVLQGGLSLNPGLLVLFPSSGTHAPSLSAAEFGVELSEPEEKSLSRPIEIKDIEGLTQAEAVWFGKVLQARPGLLEQVPKTVLDLLSDSLFEAVDLRERDANSRHQFLPKISHNPLSDSTTALSPGMSHVANMKTEPESCANSEDLWSCLGAIDLDRRNLLVFWESSWHSADEYDALCTGGNRGWLVHARGDDQLLIAWEPTIESKSVQASPRSLVYDPVIEVRKNRPGLLGRDQQVVSLGFLTACGLLLQEDAISFKFPQKISLVSARRRRNTDALENVFNSHLDVRAPDSKFAAIFKRLKAKEEL
ncbi:unnamed protein product [Alternaria alternata]